MSVKNTGTYLITNLQPHKKHQRHFKIPACGIHQLRTQQDGRRGARRPTGTSRGQHWVPESN